MGTGNVVDNELPPGQDSTPIKHLIGKN